MNTTSDLTHDEFNHLVERVRYYARRVGLYTDTVLADRRHHWWRRHCTEDGRRIVCVRRVRRSRGEVVDDIRAAIIRQCTNVSAWERMARARSLNRLVDAKLNPRRGRP